MRLLITITLATMLMALNASKPLADEQMHYIGFNAFAAERKAESAAAFDSYLRRLMPIMARYEMTLSVYDVVHGGSADLPGIASLSTEVRVR